MAQALGDDFVSVVTVLQEHPAVHKANVVQRQGTDGQAYLAAEITTTQSALANLENLTQLRVSRWQKVYDMVYAKNTAATGTPAVFNTIGWNSSYSGTPIADDAMREWVECTVQRIEGLGRCTPEHDVLELGCGTGLLLSRLAPQCRRYVATDLTTKNIRALVNKTPALAHVQIHECGADDFTALQGQTFDLIIINSVTQCFPHGVYLLQVLQQAAATLRPGGKFFIGDARSLPLLRMFHASVAWERGGRAMTSNALAEKVRARVMNDVELVIDPRLFVQAVGKLPNIGYAQVLPKRGSVLHEMNKYRFDAVLHAGNPPLLADGDIDWVPTIQTPYDLLGDGRHPTKGARGIANPRLAFDQALYRWMLTGAGKPPPGSPLHASAEEGVHVEALASMAQQHGRDVQLSWASADAYGAYDAVVKPPESAWVPMALFTDAAQQPGNLTNLPQEGELVQRLKADLQERAIQRLAANLRPAQYDVTLATVNLLDHV